MGSDGGGYTGLLVDYGGVLTTSLFDSFASFCELEGLAPQELAQKFRKDPEARSLLIALETGEIEEEDFEPQLAAILGVQAPSLIDRLFAGSGPEKVMLAAVLGARNNGIRTGLISNSWGTRRYDREQLERLFDGSRDLGRGRNAQADAADVRARRGTDRPGAGAVRVCRRSRVQPGAGR
jgi:hypothetical protein